MISAIHKTGMTSLFNLLFLSALVLSVPAHAQTAIFDKPQGDSASDLQPTAAQSSEIAQRSDADANDAKPDRIN